MTKGNFYSYKGAQMECVHSHKWNVPNGNTYAVDKEQTAQLIARKVENHNRTNAIRESLGFDKLPERDYSHEEVIVEVPQKSIHTVALYSKEAGIIKIIL